MAAPGLPTAKIEIEFTAGVWTDVTTDVPMNPGITITRGRADEFGTVSPTTLNFVLENIPDSTAAKIQKYTPDNPLSPYYPNIVEGIRVRITYTHSAIAYVRGIVYVTAWLPAFPGGELNTATVAVSCVDVLGVFGQMKSDYAQQVLKDNPTVGADLYLFTETGTPSSVTNSGLGGSPAQTLTVPTGATVTFGTDTALNLDGVLTVTASSTGATPYFTLPRSGNGGDVIEFWVKTTSAVGGTILNFQGVVNYIGLVVSGSILVATFRNGLVTDTKQINDGNWHHLAIVRAATWDCYVDGALVGSYALFANDPVGCTFGGPGTMTGTFVGLPAASYAGLAVGWDSSNLHYIYGLPNQTVAAQTRFAELASYSPLAPSTTVIGTDNRLVIRKPTAGVYITDAMQELASTVGGFIWVDPTGLLTMIMSDANRPTTVAATVTMESDDDASNTLTWKRAVDSIPKGVTVTSPLGNAFAGVTTGKQSSLTTCSATPTDALDAGASLVNASAKLRIATLQVDLSDAQTDLYAAFMALYLGNRLRATNLPSGGFGYTYEDAYVQGWVETLNGTDYTFNFDTTPADAPPDGIFDDATYGRFASDGATVTGGSCVGNTGTGTLIVTTTNGSSPTWTTTGGDYPMDLDWNGERVTVSGVGGSSSPQTFTVTARGVAPSVARVHTTSESIDVYDAACFAF